jgi:ATP-dependent Lon protease
VTMERTKTDISHSPAEGKGTNGSAEVAFLRERVRAAGLAEGALALAETELARLDRLPSASAEYGLARAYFDWILALPWNHRSEDHLDIAEARRQLDAGHFGLDYVKEQIIDRIAVMKTRADGSAPVIGFVGPTGTGKTSLGHSIARTLGRELVRLNLRGLRDESDIIGQRRVTTDAMPGRIIRALRNAGTRNPVIVLEEAGKLGTGGRGDIVSALVEAIDSRLRQRFTDQYLDVPFDLSEVFFIVTANSLEALPESLANCFDAYFLPGYVQEEKFEIARKHLLPREREKCGLREDQFEISEHVLKQMVRSNPREAGVGGLQEQIAELARKASRVVADGVHRALRLTEMDLGALPRGTVDDTTREIHPEVGVVRAMIVSPEGAAISTIEVSLIPGQKDVSLTGPQSHRLRELVQNALTILRARATRFDLKPEAFDSARLHIHVPDELAPSDLPSLGMPIVAALISAFTGKPIRADVALTGGITLRGRLREVRGVVDKVLAARRLELAHVVVPAENAKDFDHLPVYVRDAVQIHAVADVDEALRFSMLQIIVPKPEEASALTMLKTEESAD